MPENATAEELHYAQRRLDDYLDVIDVIHARLMRDEVLDSRRDNNYARDMVDSFDNEA